RASNPRWQNISIAIRTLTLDCSCGEPMKRASAIAAILAAVVLSAVPSWSQEKIRLGLSSVSAIHSAVWVAEQKGLFRKHGLDPEIIVIGGAAPMAVSALLAGDIKFATAAGDGVINSGLQRLVARPEIRSQADIKGKKIGVTRIGAVSHAALLIILRRWGMT